MRLLVCIVIFFIPPALSFAQYEAGSDDCGEPVCPEIHAQLDDYTIRMAERSKFRTLAEQRRVTKGMPAKFVVIAWGNPKRINPSGAGNSYSESWWYERQRRSILVRIKFDEEWGEARVTYVSD